MNKTVSIYLDLLRFLSAVLVVLFHANYDRFYAGRVPFAGAGLDAVMVFFVLSGFVIAHTARHKDRDLGTFALNRLSRLYSVALPALVLTVLLDQVGRQIDPVLYDGPWYADSDPVLRFLAALFFLNEIWFESIRPFSNGPYWSLAFEAWYYVLFAVAFYLRGLKRVLGLAAVALFIGPKILLLLPVWLLGCLLERLQNRVRLPETAALYLFYGSLMVLVLHGSLNGFVFFDTLALKLLGPEAFAALGFCRHFLNGYFVGALVFANLLALTACPRILAAPMAKIEKPARLLASFTFSLYLLHYPLLQFFAALFDNDPANPWHFALILACLSLCVYLVGRYTEQKKEHLRQLLQLARRSLTT